MINDSNLEVVRVLPARGHTWLPSHQEQLSERPYY